MKPLTFHVKKEYFGHLKDGGEAQLFTLINPHGASASVSNYGGIITAIHMPDRTGTLGNVVLGYDNLPAYEDNDVAMGAFVGRFANRIAGGSFLLDGRRVELTRNKGPHHLHGGIRGFHKHLWAAQPRLTDDRAQLILRRTSPDGEEGFPGTLDIELVYSLTADNALVMDVTATTDVPTIINVTQHSYFNLSAARSSVLDHELTLCAEEVLITDADLIPTGETRTVADTPFDFRSARRIGEQITSPDPMLAIGRGYDHCYVLQAGAQPAALLRHHASGRQLTITSDEPAMQLYTGNWLTGVQEPRSGLCLETQHHPDSPNHKGFPSTVLRPGEVFKTRTTYQFGVIP